MAIVAEFTKVVNIYALTDPRSGAVRYVGKAGDPAARLRQHMQPGQLERYKSKKNSWLKSLAALGLQPGLVILDTVSLEEGDEAERRWIATWPQDALTNGTRGGDGGAVTCPEALERIRCAHLGSRHSPETIARMSRTHKVQASSPAERARLRKISNGSPPVLIGESNPMSRLTDEQVREIRERVDAGELSSDLAVEYGQTYNSVWQIIVGRNRRSAGGPIQPIVGRKAHSKEL